MKIEFVEFYLAKKTGRKIVGTLHIYLCDLGIDIRGCPVKKSAAGSWSFFFPSKNGFDEDEQKEVSYPVIEFTDQALKKEIQQFMYDSGPKFVEESLKNNPKRIKHIFKSGKAVKEPEKKPFTFKAKRNNIFT